MCRPRPFLLTTFSVMLTAGLLWASSFSVPAWARTSQSKTTAPIQTAPLKPVPPVLPPVDEIPTNPNSYPTLPPLQGQVQTQQAPMNSPNPPVKAKPTLKGGVSTYDAILEAEKGMVDWYGWYMACRRYITANAGLQCNLGTPIHIYKNGQFDTPSQDPYCLLSVRTKRFPLPTNTRLNMLILPVRSGAAPPASPEELQRRTQGWR
jgi:hypothetical protein